MTCSTAARLALLHFAMLAPAHLWAINLDQRVDVPAVTVQLKETPVNDPGPAIEMEPAGLNSDCSNFYEAVCGDMAMTLEQMERQDAEIVHVMMEEYDTLRAASRQNDKELFLAELDRVMREDLLKRGIDVEAALESIRLSVLQAVEAQPRPNVAAAQGFEAMEKILGLSQARTTLNRDWLGHCHDDGFRPTAFEGRLGRLHIVTLCPGITLQAYARAENQDDFESYLYFNVSHELGHGIGPDHSQTQPYGLNYMYDHLDAAMFRGHQGPGSIDEWAPDFWSAESLALKARRSRLDPRSLLNILRKSYRNLCLSPSDSEHGSPRERIEIALGRNARMRRALKCPALPKGEAGTLIESDDRGNR